MLVQLGPTAAFCTKAPTRTGSWRPGGVGLWGCLGRVPMGVGKELGAHVQAGGAEPGDFPRAYSQMG